MIAELLMGPQRRWGTGWGLLLVLATALTMRLVALGHLQPWEDEVWSYYGSTDFLDKMLRWETPGNREHSPLPFMEIKAVRAVLGPSWWALRLPSALYGTAAVVVFYLVVSRWIGARAALVGGLLLAVHPYCVEWHRWARMYGGWSFYALVGVGLLLAAAERMRRDEKASPLDWRWWLLGVVLMLMHASAIHGVMTIAGMAAALGVLAVVEGWRRPVGALRIALGGAVSGGVYLTSWAATGLGKILMLSHTTGEEPGVDAGQVFAGVMLGAVRHFGGHVSLGVGLAFFALAATGLGLLLALRRWPLVVVLLLVSVLSVISIFIISHLHMVDARYGTVLLFPLALGAAAALCGLWGAPAGWPRRAARTAAAAIVLGLCLCWAPAWATVYAQEWLDSRSALAPIQAQAQPGEMVVPVPEWYEVLLRFYEVTPRTPLLFPPQEARVFRTRALPQYVGPGRQFGDDFERFWGPQRDPAAPRPPALCSLSSTPTTAWSARGGSSRPTAWTRTGNWRVWGRPRRGP